MRSAAAGRRRDEAHRDYRSHGGGKTTVLGVLEALGAEIIDCDAVYHDLLERSGPLRRP